MTKPAKTPAKRWRSGPPPSIGWWPASVYRIETAIRWWDGACWSCAAYPACTPQQAAHYANQKTSLSDKIRWLPRPASWPARSHT